MSPYDDPRQPSDATASPGGRNAVPPQNRAIIRAAFVNMVLLVAATVLFIRLGGSGIGLWVLVGVALVCGLNMTRAVFRSRPTSQPTPSAAAAAAAWEAGGATSTVPGQVDGVADGGVRGPTSYADLTGPGSYVPRGDAGAGHSGTASPYGSPSPFGTPAGSESGELALEVEDVFSITGRGTVVTGRIASGTVRVGEWVRIVREGQEVARAEVNGIEQFRKVMDVAVAGELVGLLLAGVRRDQVTRGDLVTF